MPTPDGREWLSPRAIITLQLEQIERDHPNMTAQQRESLRESLEEGFRLTNYHQEFKIARLVEKVKEAIFHKNFGPLQVPNTVDVNGLPINTPVGEIAYLLADIYSEGFLDQFDDDGELLPLDSGDG
ncbi:MAG: hypothetical protein ACYTFQ_19095 [Planctomycetota bacterium]|jgi:hypothetical protein